MARARNIKPGFYTNEELAGCSLYARFIFPGLWMHADRAGRLEDRPLRLKATLLPYDNANIDELLNELANAGLILRYQMGEARYIQVINFEKHQNPHQRESESTIPAPDEIVQAQDKHDASTVQAQCQHHTSPADSFNPITDSLNPITTDAPDKPARFNPLAYLLSLGVSETVCKDWLTLRKQKRAAVTPTAISGIQREAGKAKVSLQAALQTCCERGWQGFRAEWLVGNPPTGSPPRSSGRNDAISNYAAQAAAARGEGNGITGSNERDITGESCRVG